MFFPPLINDITTTYPNPPQFVALPKIEVGRSYDYPSAFYEKQKEYYKDLKPLSCPLQKDHCFQFCVSAAKDMSDWKIVEIDERQFRIEAVATTQLFRYQDDVVIELRPQQDHTAIHMRSKSRKGKGDLGANGARIKKYLELVESLIKAADK